MLLSKGATTHLRSCDPAVLSRAKSAFRIAPLQQRGARVPSTAIDRRLRPASSRPTVLAALEETDAMEKAILERLPDILQSCDWDQTTERGIRERLAEELGGPVEEYKTLIKVRQEA